MAIATCSSVLGAAHPGTRSGYTTCVADGDVEIRDSTEVFRMRVREIDDAEERARVWATAVAAFPPYEDYGNRAAPNRAIPVFLAEPA